MNELAKDITLEQIESEKNMKASSSNLDFGTVKCGDKLATLRYQLSLYNNILHTVVVKIYALKLNIPADSLEKNVH